VSLIDKINFGLGFFGLIASILGLYISYETFINPLIRFNRYLSRPLLWEKFIGMKDSIYFFRYKELPNFQISVKWDFTIVDNFFEEWMKNIFIADKTNNSSYLVGLEANGMLLDKELFVSLDGHRYFVPAPRIMLVEDERIFFYEGRQIYLAQIVGSFGIYEDIFEFSKTAGISINMSL
jgi:hypothetical protein